MKKMKEKELEPSMSQGDSYKSYWKLLHKEKVHVFSYLFDLRQCSLQFYHVHINNDLFDKFLHQILNNMNYNLSFIRNFEDFGYIY